ncbi:hypothetical protein OIU79_026165 [Salix purpurea]|uniref:Uncharacterized protein n=1 Tax=Salix purpurea TaxID=77065 RepID=A0A9Q0VR82_SALPP|nr:hypothetical protein OIU79_026165 [Salix purpurea]
MRKTIILRALLNRNIKENELQERQRESKTLLQRQPPIFYSNPPKGENVLRENRIFNLCLEMLRMDTEKRPLFVLFKWAQTPQKRLITAALIAKKPR